MKGIPIPADPFGERGPGAHLRQAREAANISADKIAASLLLDPKIIEALEADSFDRLPAPTFVRGYLRGYARLLGLPAGPILEMYDRHGFQPPPLDSGVAEMPQAHTSDTVVRLVTYAVGAVLVLLVGLWWHSQGGEGFDISGDLFDWSSDPALDPSLAAAEAPGTAPVGGEPIAMAPTSRQSRESSQDDGPLAPSPTEGAASGDIAADGPVPAEAVLPETMTGRETSTTPAPQSDAAAGADPNAEAGSAGADGEESPAPDGTDRADAASESGSVTLPAVTPPAVPDTAQSGLVLEFPHESWVEVYDRERTRLFFGLVQPGRVLNINGAQPFDVLLGFGTDVRVTVDGEAFDHTPYMKHGVARFNIGAGPTLDTETAEFAESTAPAATDSPAATSPPPSARPMNQ